MAHLFDTTWIRCEASTIASTAAAVSMVGANDPSGTVSALAMGCAP